jgi:hypothetical protein
MKGKKVIYTALFNNYDKLDFLKKNFSGFSQILFTNLDIKSSIWKIIKVKSTKNPELLNRKYKILAHKFLKKFDESLYFDANIILLKNPKKLFHRNLKSFNISLMRHFSRKCLYEEALVLIRSGRFSNLLILKQIFSYILSGMPKNYCLFENSILFRKHNNRDLIRLMDEWWFETQKYSHRDQLSLPYVIWKKNYSFYLSKNFKRNSNFFTYDEHSIKHNNNFFKKIKNFINYIFFYVVIKIFLIINL